ncbi:hypothetical protein V8B97DRAFT_2037313, partial [Scleroderma yunnanense]
TSLATGPLIRPTWKNTKPVKPTGQQSAEVADKKLNNLMSHHHPSCLILQINNPPVPGACLMGKHMVDAINTALHPEMDVRTIRVKWNNKGNCIVITNPQFTTDDLLPFYHPLGPIIADNSTYKAIPDKEWHQVLLNGVDTGKSDIDDEMDGLHFQGQDTASIMMELKANNPCMANVTFLKHPCWIAHLETLSTKMHSSVILTVSLQEEVDYLIHHVSGLFMFGKYTSLTHFQDTKPV